MSAMTTNDYEYDEEEEIAVALCVSFWLCVLLDNVLERKWDVCRGDNKDLRQTFIP